MADRAALIAAFLDRAGWGGAARAALAADASFRRYDRLAQGAARAVLMDAPPPGEDVRPFAAICRHLRALGYSAPGIVAEDAGAGLLLLEDFGDDTFTRLLARGADETALYMLACDLLVDLHRRDESEAVPAGLAPYDEAALLREARLLAKWYAPRALGAPLPPATAREYDDLWRLAFRGLADAPRTLVLRDFHVDNLIRLEGRHGVAACGLLDFQDALHGPAAYDLVSLVEDARRDIADGLRQAVIDRYCAALYGIDRDGLMRAMAILGAQRHAKVIGIFTRLCDRDGKPGYLSHIPRVWRLLERSLAHPSLSALRAWFDAHIPPDARRAPKVAS
ncbi:MAG: phosphotransferase [Alphaproteobacteria bacterium]|nr:phosphotransferase [Alphaproteobacteria bacterium]